MAKNNTKKLVYVEPADYFPKELRKEFKLGEYAEDAPKAKKATPKKKRVKQAMRSNEQDLIGVLAESFILHLKQRLKDIRLKEMADMFLNITHLMLFA